MQLYDFDALFDKKLAKYVKEHGNEYGADELEDAVPALYKKFGDTVIKAIGKTPNSFYSDMSDEQLVKTLRAHVRNGVPVPGFLNRALENRAGCTELLLPVLRGNDGEIAAAMNVLGAVDAAIHEYMNILASADSDEIKDACTDYIKEKADIAAEQALKFYADGIERGRMLEILSRCTVRDDRIFDILIKEFRTDSENLPMLAGYLAAYGDERALPYLMDRIDEEGISYADFRELKYAVETLGGEYNKERDFSDDAAYILIKSHGEQQPDLFSGFDKADKN